MSNQTLIDRLEAVTPVTSVTPSDVDRAWDEFEAIALAAQRRLVRRRTLVVTGSLASLGAVAALIVGLLPSAPTPSAAAATLRSAAMADASSAALPSLAFGQYYYQEAQVAMDCTFASAGIPFIRYVSTGTIQSWTSPNSAGEMVITPTPVSQGGSHFATPGDEAEWVAAGKPFVPCALWSPSNSLDGNPANAIPGGYAAAVSGYSGFGVILGDAKVASPIDENGIPALILNGSASAGLSADTNVASLPSDVSQLMSMLANGEINVDGSVSSTPQTCPVNAMPGAGTGCDINQQLALIKELLQLPDASAKLGSVLYQVLAQMPGASVVTNASDCFGNRGTSVTVPVLVGTTTTGGFQVLIDPATGTLLSSSDLLRAGFGIGNGGELFPPDASISYGPISVVAGLGTVPSKSN
jgi:hypothetical protein